MTRPRPLDNIGRSARFQRQRGPSARFRGLNLPRFGSKAWPMTSRGDRFGGGGGALRLFPRLALALALLIPGAVSAQMFSDRPPPVPPSSIPDAPGGPALNLAPPSGSLPSLPPTLTQPTIAQPSIVPPPIATVPPAAPP